VAREDVALFRSLVKANQKAFDKGMYSVAYHALAAALHCAQCNEDEVGLTEVEKAAGEQGSLIDLYAPDYEHSTRSSETRGRTSIFALLARQASTRRSILHHEQERANRKWLPLLDLLA